MSQARPTSVIVLCVDRDNDVGEVAGVQTPIVGEEAVKRAAVEFAAKRPDDSDVNAIFAALKLYHQLREQGGMSDVEVALVAGHKDEGVKADMRISEELDAILSVKRFDAAVLVSDGPTDEMVLPLIQSKLPVLSVHRVVVQQSRGVEESFILFLRYARRLFEEEKYKKYAMGIPGGLITMYVVLSILVPGYVWPLLGAALGLAMLIKGFSIDEYVAKTYRSSPILLTALVASALIAFLALASGLGGISSLSGVKGVEVLGYFLLTSLGEQVLVLDLFFVAALLPLLAQAVEAALGGRQLGTREAVATVLLVVLRQVLLEYARLLVGAGSVLSLLLWVALAILTLAAVVAVFSLLGYSRAREA